MKELNLMRSIMIELSKHGICLRMNTGIFKTMDDRTVKVGVKGTSDLLFIGQGHIAFLEVKTDTGRPTKEQLNFIEQIKMLGHRAAVVRSVAEALEVVGK